MSNKVTLRCEGGREYRSPLHGVDAHGGKTRASVAKAGGGVVPVGLGVEGNLIPPAGFGVGDVLTVIRAGLKFEGKVTKFTNDAIELEDLNAPPAPPPIDEKDG